MTFKALAQTLAAGALVVGSIGAAQAFPQFTVQEGSIPGAFPNAVTGDEFKGSYIELIQGDFIASSFTTAGVFQITTIALNGVNVPTQIGGFSPLGNNYNLYALFEFSGSLGLNAAGDITFTPTVGSIAFWADPSQNTTFNEILTGFTTNNAGDDVLLASTSDLISGAGNGRLGANQGDFAVFFDNLTLTAAGSAYFIDPNPFYMILRADGNFTSFTPAPAFPTFSSRVTGSGQVQLPEPASLALLGLVAAGLGVFGLRKRAA
jgi:hypothetical protein